MKKISYLLACIFIITFSCKTTEHNQNNTNLITIEGELYFKLIELGSFYGVEDSIIQKFQIKLDKIDSDSSSSDQFISDYYKMLDENDLLKIPHFKVIVDSIQILQVFLMKNSIEKLKIIIT